MIWQIIEIIAVLAESFLAVRFNYGYFQLRNEKNKVLKLSAGTLVLSLWDYFWTVYAKSEIWSMAGFAAILFLFSILFLKNSAFEKFIIAVISCTLFYFINLPVLYIFSHIFNRTVLEMTLSQGPERVFILFLTKMLYFAVTQMFVYFRQKQAFIFKKNEWVLITTEFTITLLISFLLYSLSVSTWNKLYTYTIIVLMLTFLDTIAFTFMKKINAKNTEETEKKLLKLSLEQQAEMIDKIKMQYDSLLEMRHNYVHELAYLKGVLSEKNYDKINDYITEKLSSEKLQGYNYIFTSNKVIDSVINYKFSNAEQKGISVVCSLTAEIPESYERDVSIILSNLLDNAIEASGNLKNAKPEIILNVHEIAGYYSILVKNRISSSVLENNKKLQTSKSDKKNHGYGLKTVRMLSETHNGMVDVYENDSYFIVNVLLNI